MKEKFVWAVKCQYGRIDKNKCTIVKETEKQLTISSVYGMGGTNVVKKSEMCVWGWDIVYEKDLTNYLKNELQKNIQRETQTLESCKKKIAFYNEELLKLN